MTPNCTTCDHLKPYVGEAVTDIIGQCRRYPPVPTDMIQSEQPWVTATDACGEYRG